VRTMANDHVTTCEATITRRFLPTEWRELGRVSPGGVVPGSSSVGSIATARTYSVRIGQRPPLRSRRQRGTGRRSAAALITIASSAATAAAAVPVAYLGVLTAFAVSRRRPSAAVNTHPGSTRFVVLVPAHDEAATIADTVDSLLGQHYPTDMFSVHVVADNCTDATAAIASRHGARVHERFDPARRGKGHALNWLVSELLSADHAFDAAAFVDADTLVDGDFLSELDVAFVAGARAVQGHYSVRAAFESVPASFRYCALACRHHLRPLGRSAIGGSCGLFGNGMAFTRDLVVSRRWTNHLVEDLQFQADLLLDGVRVEYLPNARVEAEMPNTLDASETQHRRWELGRAQMVREYVPQFTRGLLTGRPDRRIAYLDELGDLCTPPLSLLAPAALGAAAISLPLAVRPFRNPVRAVNAAVALTSLAVLGCHVLVGLRLVRAPKAAYRSLMSAPSMIVWKIRVVFARPRADDTSWIRTSRNAPDLSPDVRAGARP